MRNDMRSFMRTLAVRLSIAFCGSPGQLKAQAYPIDCAILLCLSAGWPASEPCSRASAEFFRRITPWPVEPPLQIWRCPMRASDERDPTLKDAARILRVVGQNALQSSQVPSYYEMPQPPGAVWRSPKPAEDLVLTEDVQHFIQDRADIDISSPEFDFVRSIRVFHIRSAVQHESDPDLGCSRTESVRVGTYGQQGDFFWSESAVFELPPAHQGLEDWGDACVDVHHRSVFIEWHDYDGHYGFEQVNY